MKSVIIRFRKIYFINMFTGYETFIVLRDDILIKRVAVVCFVTFWLTTLHDF